MRQAKAANRMPSTVRHPPTLAPVAVRGFGRLFSAADARNEAGTTAALYGQRQRNRQICFEPEDAADTEQTDNSQWIVLHLGMEEQRLRSRECRGRRDYPPVPLMGKSSKQLGSF